jgi:hypothetical protein
MLVVIEGVLAPVLHNIVPAHIADNTEALQLFTTVTTGFDGNAFGAAIPEPAILVQPLTVCVTVGVQAVVTVMERVLAPVLHNKDPVAVVDKIDEPQLFATVTRGLAGNAFGAAVPGPVVLVQPLTV